MILRESLVSLSVVLLLAAAPSAQVCGDCNGDGVLSVLDALLAAQIGVALVVPTPTQEWVCDVDSSSDVAVLDALLLAQAAAGLGAVLACPPPPVEPEWVRSAGTPGYDRGHAVATESGSIYLAGTREFVSGAGADAWVMARGNDGALLWERVLRAPGGSQLELLAIAASGGTIYAGGIRRTLQPPVPDDVDLFVIALDGAGALLWQRQILDASVQESMNSLTILADGSLLALAERTPTAGGSTQAWILNLESNGDLRWQKEISSPDGCRPLRARERSPMGTFVAGAFTPPGGAGFDARGWLLSLDAAGNLLWQRQYEPPGVGNTFRDVLPDATGLWVVGSMCNSCFFLDDSWLVRTDLSGILVSSTVFGDYAGNELDQFDRILPLAGGDLAIVGSSQSLPFTGRFSTVHVLDAAGSPLWTRAYGETPRFTYALDAALTAAGAIAFTGTSNYVISPSLSDAYFGKVVPQSPALDSCAAVTVLTDIARDITSSVAVSIPAGVVEAATLATTADPGFTIVAGSPSPLDIVHCTN